jgi:hypothetical protein
VAFFAAVVFFAVVDFFAVVAFFAGAFFLGLAFFFTTPADLGLVTALVVDARFLDVFAFAGALVGLAAFFGEAGLRGRNFRVEDGC